MSMKLHEYLKQFEGLDPEMEVYNFDKEGFEILPRNKTPYVRSYYVSSFDRSDTEWFTKANNQYQREVLVID